MNATTSPPQQSPATLYTRLSMTRLTFTARTTANFALPPYAGSMLRGAFGHALKAQALLPHPDNTPCALQANCPYCQVFISPALPDHALQTFSQMPAPYVIEPPRGNRVLDKGKSFRFNLVLIGHALGHLPVIVTAFENALARGLGQAHTPCDLTAVHDEAGALLWQPGHAVTAPAPHYPHATSSCVTDSATLTFHTPLRVRQRGKPARANQLSARSFLLTLARRWQLLADVHLGEAAPQQHFDTLIEQTRPIQLDTAAMHWFDWARYSSRQKQTMKFGGLMGTLTLTGDLHPFAPLLHLGQWLHVGKETAFGLGQYTLEQQGK